VKLRLILIGMTAGLLLPLAGANAGAVFDPGLSQVGASTDLGRGAAPIAENYWRSTDHDCDKDDKCDRDHDRKCDKSPSKDRDCDRDDRDHGDHDRDDHDRDHDHDYDKDRKCDKDDHDGKCDKDDHKDH
jgi:hypothetical protein